jgi:urease accessory protein UreH
VQRRTIVTELVCEGLLRASRALRDGPSEPPQILTTVLGPGLLRGDRHEVVGTVGSDAALAFGATSATKVYGGAEETTSSSRWLVAAGGRLELLGEPTIAFEGARYRSTIRVTLGERARLVILETLTVPPEVRSYDIDLRIFVRRGETIVAHDVLRLSSERYGRRITAIGTLLVESGGGSSENQAILRKLDALIAAENTLRAGADLLASGAVLLRTLGDDVYTLHAFLQRARRLSN